MKSLTKFPSQLIENFCTNFCNELWDEAITSGNTCMELASSICDFRDDLRNIIIKELSASSIVEEK